MMGERSFKVIDAVIAFGKMEMSNVSALFRLFLEGMSKYEGR